MARASQYSDSTCDEMQLVYGEGYLSPGGAEEVDAMLEGFTVRGRRVLDLGCGVGGAAIRIVRELGAGAVVGIDVEERAPRRGWRSAWAFSRSQLQPGNRDRQIPGATRQFGQEKPLLSKYLTPKVRRWFRCLLSYGVIRRGILPPGRGDTMSSQPILEFGVNVSQDRGAALGHCCGETREVISTGTFGDRYNREYVSRRRTA